VECFERVLVQSLIALPFSPHVGITPILAAMEQDMISWHNWLCGMESGKYLKLFTTNPLDPAALLRLGKLH